jgi:glycosyltransferase involved in cell wall biosynthesis
VAARARHLANLWTSGLACSRPAAAELFGQDWERNPRVRILYCGVDLSPFHSAPDHCARTELGLPDNAFVVGHVGRFNEQKNHAFLVDIAEQVIMRDSNVWFVLIGEGEEKVGIQKSVAKRGLAHRFVFEGHRNDIPRVMLDAMDVFLLPSFHEGLPLVGMEAQAAGLPMVVSDAITTEMDGVPGLIRRLSLHQTAAEWAEAVLNLKATGPGVAKREALAAMEDGPFNIQSSVQALQSFYEECVLGPHSGAV